MSTKKLEKVLEYLISNQQDKAKELLHQVFIEKARSIHEELINMDEEEMELEDGCGDEGADLKHDVEGHSDHLDELSDEIEAEETMAEDEDMMDVDMPDMGGDDMSDDADMGDDADMMDMGDMDDMGDEDHADVDAGDVDVEAIEDTMGDLEDALAELKAEFEKLEAGGDAGEEVADEEGEEDFEAGEEAGEEEASDEEASDEEGEEEEMDESWLAEFDDLEESVDLEKVAVPHGEGEVGSGHYSKVEANTKSPTAKAPDAMFGAKPVKTGQGATKSGFEKEAAPSSEQLKGMKPDNRRKKSTDGSASVSKEGDNSALLNKKGEGFGEANKKSPLTTSPRK